MGAVDVFSEGERCAALLDLPTAVERPVPGVVLCAGFRGTKEWLLGGLAASYVAAGWAVLRFDYRGIGASQGRRGHLCPARQVEDVRNAVAFLGASAGVDPARVSAHGVGMGGGHALVAAAQDRAICAVVVQAALGDVRRAWLDPMPTERRGALERRLAADRRDRVHAPSQATMDPGEIMDNPQSRAAFARAAERFPGLGVPFTLEAIERVLEYAPERCAAQVAPRGVLVVGATQDRAAPVEESRRLFDAAREPRRLELFDAAHYELFELPLCERIVTTAVTWIEEHRAAVA